MRILILPTDWLHAKGLEVVLCDSGDPICLEPLPGLERLLRRVEQDETAILVVWGDEQLLVEVEQELARACRRVGVLAIVPVDTPVVSLVWWVRQGRSFLFDTADPEMLRMAVRVVAAGCTFVDPAAVCRLFSGVEDESWGTQALRRLDPGKALSPHTWGVALLIGLGWHDHDIAEYLGRTANTVESYQHEVYCASGISGRGELMHRVQGRPPCGGMAVRCVAPGPGLQTLSRDSIASCPCFPVCVAALRNY